MVFICSNKQKLKRNNAATEGNWWINQKAIQHLSRFPPEACFSDVKAIRQKKSQESSHESLLHTLKKSFRVTLDKTFLLTAVRPLREAGQEKNGPIRAEIRFLYKFLLWSSWARDENWVHPFSIPCSRGWAPNSTKAMVHSLEPSVRKKASKNSHRRGNTFLILLTEKDIFSQALHARKEKWVMSMQNLGVWCKTECVWMGWTLSQVVFNSCF